MNRIPENKYLKEGDISVVTMELIKAYHTKEEVKIFCKWHSGQTGIVMKNGKHGIYSWDYERWLSEGRLNHQLPGTWD